MIGLVVIGCDIFPESILISLQITVGKLDNICAVPLRADEVVEKQRQAILTAIKHVDTGHGVLVFTDSMNNPAGHLTLSIIDEVNIEVIGGVNLPMLSKVVEKRDIYSLEKLAEFARDEGRKAITWRRP